MIRLDKLQFLPVFSSILCRLQIPVSLRSHVFGADFYLIAHLHCDMQPHIANTGVACTKALLRSAAADRVIRKYGGMLLDLPSHLHLDWRSMLRQNSLSPFALSWP